MSAWRPAALALVLAAQPLIAAPAQAQTVTEDELVVTGRRIDEAVRNFVEELSAPTTSEDQLGRWNREICVGAIGIRARYGQYLVDRISQRAVQIGLQAGSPGCRANVVVFVTPDANRLAAGMVEQFQSLMAVRYSDNTVTAGGEALDAFVNTPRPVRWWHVAYTTTADGQTLRDAPASNGASGMRGQVVRTTSLGFGRLSRTTRQDFNRVIIIIDATQAAGVQFDALADYVAMVALAQVDPDADTSEADTILNLFNDRSAGRPSGMTEWDLAYLNGLYAAPRNARSADAQESAIARSMGEEITAPPE